METVLDWGSIGFIFGHWEACFGLRTTSSVFGVGVGFGLGDTMARIYWMGILGVGVFLVYPFLDSALLMRGITSQR